MQSPAAAAVAAQPVIAVRGLVKRYGDLVAVDGIDFDVAPGEIFGLLGPNGGGKTTLFRLLCTLLPFQEGRAVLAGHDVAAAPAAVRHAIGVTFQSPSLDGKSRPRSSLIVVDLPEPLGPSRPKISP